MWIANRDWALALKYCFLLLHGAAENLLRCSFEGPAVRCHPGVGRFFLTDNKIRFLNTLQSTEYGFENMARKRVPFDSVSWRWKFCSDFIWDISNTCSRTDTKPVPKAQAQVSLLTFTFSCIWKPNFYCKCQFCYASVVHVFFFLMNCRIVGRLFILCAVYSFAGSRERRQKFRRRKK